MRRGDLLLVLNPTAEPVVLDPDGHDLLTGRGATLVLSSAEPIAARPVAGPITVPPDTCWWLHLDRTPT